VFLKEEIVFFFGSFGMPISEKRLIRKGLIHIERTYSKILYLGEWNPVEELIKENAAKTQKPSFFKRLLLTFKNKI
jgi:hypothetical protein